MTAAFVLDYPSFVRGLLERLQLTEDNPGALLTSLAARHQVPYRLLRCEHPVEVDLQEEDIRKLVILSCILGGAEAIVVDRPVLAQMTGTAESPAPKFCRFDGVRQVWLKPRNPLGPVVTPFWNPYFSGA